MTAGAVSIAGPASIPKYRCAVGATPSAASSRTRGGRLEARGDVRDRAGALANFATLLCGSRGAVRLESSVAPSRGSARLPVPPLVCDASDGSCHDQSLWWDRSLRRRYKCEMTRPLCRGGVRTYAGPDQTVGGADDGSGARHQRRTPA